METGELAFSGKRREQHPALRFALILMVAMLMAVTARIVFVAPHVIFLAKRQKLTNEMFQVQTAMSSYYTEYSEYPTAHDNATLIKMLNGESAEGNQRHIAFVSFMQSDFDAKGELLDPWGTPIDLSVTADGKLHARSAGPDKIFGTPDDITNQ